MAKSVVERDTGVEMQKEDGKNGCWEDEVDELNGRNVRSRGGHENAVRKKSSQNWSQLAPVATLTHALGR